MWKKYFWLWQFFTYIYTTFSQCWYVSSVIWSDKNVSYHSRCGALKSPQKLMAMRTKHMKQYPGIELRYCLSWWTFSHACMHLISKPITSIILYFILFLYWTYNIGCGMAWITCKILNAKFGKASIYYNAIRSMTQPFIYPGE